MCHHPDIYRTEPTRRRECLYFLAVGHYKLGNYQEAKRYNSEFLRGLGEPTLASVAHIIALAGLLQQKEPTNIQAQSLAELIDSAVAKGQFGLLSRRSTSGADIWSLLLITSVSYRGLR